MLVFFPEIAQTIRRSGRSHRTHGGIAAAGNDALAQPGDHIGGGSMDKAAAGQQILQLRGALIGAAQQHENVFAAFLTAIQEGLYRIATQKSGDDDAVKGKRALFGKENGGVLLCGSGRENFSRKFSDFFGMPPKQYLNNALLNRAVQMMLKTPLLSKEIAAELGFSNEFYFSRFFKKNMGLSPRTFKHVHFPE